MLVLLLPLVLAAEPVVGVGALARVGDALPGATVERVDLHPEYERYWLRYGDGALIPAEATRASAGSEGHCTAHDVTLYLREDMGQGQPPEATAPMAALCGRLVEHPPTLRPRGGVVSEVAPPTPPPLVAPRRDTARAVLWKPLHAVVAGLVLALAVSVRRVGRPPREARGDAALVGVLALAAALLGKPGIFNGGGAAYEKIVLAWGVDVDSPYGDGFGVLYGPVLGLLSRVPGVLFALNDAVAVCAPVLLWGLVRLHADRRASLTAGIGLAALPLLLRLGPTEVMHVPVTTLSLLALVGAAGFRRGGDPALGVVGVLSATLVVYLRPEALPFPVVVAAFAFGATSRWRWPLGWALVAVVAVRLSTLVLEQDVLRPAAMLRGDVLRAALLPALVSAAHRAAGSTFWNGSLTPAGLWPFALLGAVVAPPSFRWRLLVWWVAVEAPVLAKVSPVADAVRLQLPAQSLWLVLVGLGAAALPARWLVVAPGLIGAVWFLGRPGWLRWANHDEYDVLAERVPALAADDVVVYDDVGNRGGKFARVMEVMGPARWVRASDWLGGSADGPPTHWWRGVSEDPAVTAAISARCTAARVAGGRVRGAVDEDLVIDPAGKDVAFWSIRCGPDR